MAAIAGLAIVDERRVMRPALCLYVQSVVSCASVSWLRVVSLSPRPKCQPSSCLPCLGDLP
jgi:hypothetical protein